MANSSAETAGISLLGACYWRYEGERRWRVGNAVAFNKDAVGSVDVRDECGERVTVPNIRGRIKERTA
jgi:phage-related protein